jgi:hypothetical protein
LRRYTGNSTIITCYLNFKIYIISKTFFCFFILKKFKIIILEQRSDDWLLRLSLPNSVSVTWTCVSSKTQNDANRSHQGSRFAGDAFTKTISASYATTSTSESSYSATFKNKSRLTFIYFCILCFYFVVLWVLVG